MVDAYLSPILERYLAGVSGALGAGSLHVMTSAGGLVRAEPFRAKDGLLSGPAGGVVGAARAGRRVGLRRVIAFDMGGTSTDVARWDGDFEYLFEHQVGDAHLVAPALAIESVAAGGGSICGFDGIQLKVGPGERRRLARPGLLRRGRAADADRRQPDPRPARSGPLRDPPGRRGGGPRPRTACASGWAQLDPGPEAVLAGLLEIADERMAEAIRSISLRRGYDPAGHALVAFGGAGAQHACAVAGLLGISERPGAGGRRPALGARAGRRGGRALRPAAGARAARRGCEERLAGWLDELGSEAAAAVAAEGIAPDDIVVRRRLLNLRFAGQEATLAVEFDGESRSSPPSPPPTGRSTATRRRGGRSSWSRSARSPRRARTRRVRSSIPRPPRPLPSGSRRCWLGGWREVPVFDRAALLPGATFTGPALVFESHSATLVAAGWRGRVDGAGNLALDRA